MAEQNETPQNEQHWFFRHMGVALEGIYDGGIRAVSGVGLVVDAVNHAPRLANFIPGVDGVGPMSDRPFLGSAMIYDNLTGAHDAYKDLVLHNGASTYDPQTASEHLVYGGGYMTGMAAGTIATGAGLSATSNALLGSTALTSSFNAARGGTLAMTPQSIVSNGVHAAADTSLAALRFSAVNGGKMALAHPVIATGALTGADLMWNNGALTQSFGTSAGNFVAERVGLGPIFGDAAKNNGGMLNLIQDPAKLAGMAAIMLVGGSLLGNMVNNGLIGAVLAIAGALLFHKQIGDMTQSVTNALSGATATTTAATPETDQTQRAVPSHVPVPSPM